MDVRINFEGSAFDAEAAANQMSRALDGLLALAESVSAALKGVRLDTSQTASTVANARAMARAVDEIGDKAARAKRELAGVALSSSITQAFQPRSSLGTFMPGRIFEAGPAPRSTGLISSHDMGLGQYGPAYQRAWPMGPADDSFVRAVTGSFSEPRPYGRMTGPMGNPNLAFGRDDQYRYVPFMQRGRSAAEYLASKGITDLGDGRRGRGILSGGGGGGFGGLSQLASIVPGGGRATGAAFGTAVGLAGAGLADLGPGLLAPLTLLPSLAGAAAGSLGVLTLALKGVGAAVGGDAKAFADLDAPTQKFVQNVRSVIPWLEQLQKQSRGIVLPDLQQALHAALSPSTSGMIQRQVGQFSQATGGAAIDIGKYLGGSGFGAQFGQFATREAGNVKLWTDTTLHLVDALLRLTNAFAPLEQWMVRGIDHAARIADAWVKGKQASDGFAHAIDVTKNSMRDVLLLVDALLHTLGALQQALAPVGHELVVLVSTGLNGISDWINAHQAMIQNVLIGGLAALGDVVKLVVELLGGLLNAIDLLLKPLDALVGSANAMKLAFEALIALQIASAFANLASAASAGATNMGLLQKAFVALATNPEVAAVLAALAAISYVTMKGAPGQNIQGKNGEAIVSQNGHYYVRAGRALAPFTGTLPDGTRVKNGTPIAGSGPTSKTGISPSADSPGRNRPSSSPYDTPLPGAMGDYYVQPVKPGTPIARLDQGIDYQGRPGDFVVAIGNARVDAVTDDPGGFGKAIYYTLLDGPSAGQQIYVGHAMPLVTAGQQVKRGTPVAQLLAHGLGNASRLSGWTEVGFASGNRPVSHSASDTNSAKQFQQFLGGSTTGYTPPVKTFTTPPPFDITSKAGALPVAMQTALARAQNSYLAAQGTPGTADDQRAAAAYLGKIHQAEAYLRKVMGSLNGDALLTATQELGSLISTANGIAATVHKALGAWPYALPGANKGLLAAGDINLENRPIAHGAGGDSTVLSMSIGIGNGREVLIPRVVNGKVVSVAAAIANYRKTGQNLGTFDSVAAANAYARRLHKEQAQALVRQRALLPGLQGALSDIGTAFGPVGGLLGGVQTGDPRELLTANPLGDAHARLDTTLHAQEKTIKAFEKQLKDHLISAEAVATIRSRLATIKANVASELSDIKDAAKAQAQNFRTVWDSYVQSFDEAFQKTTSDVLAHPEKYPALLPLSAALANLTDAHTQEQMKTRLEDAQKQLAEALAGVGTSGDTKGILDAARKTLSDSLLTHALDVAQSAILGGTPADMTQKILDDMHAALTAASTVDPDAVKSAQQALADAKYDIQVSGLEKEAAAEQTAFQDSRTELQKHLDETLKLWGTYYEKQGMKASEALGALNALLQKFGFTPITDPYTPGTGDFELPPGTPGAAPAGSGSAEERLRAVVGKAIPMAAGGIYNRPTFNAPFVFAERGREAYLPLDNPSAVRQLRESLGGDTMVEVSVADGMEWLKQFIDVRVIKNSGVLMTTAGRRADRMRREGRVF